MLQLHIVDLLRFVFVGATVSDELNKLGEKSLVFQRKQLAAEDFLAGARKREQAGHFIMEKESRDTILEESEKRKGRETSG